MLCDVQIQAELWADVPAEGMAILWRCHGNGLWHVPKLNQPKRCTDTKEGYWNIPVSVNWSRWNCLRMWLLHILSKCYSQCWHTCNSGWTACACLCLLVCLYVHACQLKQICTRLSLITQEFCACTVQQSYSSSDTDIRPHTYLSPLHISSILSCTSQMLSWNNKTGKVKESLCMTWRLMEKWKYGSIHS
jgi:hypothetical protein